MKSIAILFCLFGLVSNASASCADRVFERIDFAYNEGGLMVLETMGPFHWNEGVIVEGHPSLASKVAFAVNYKNDPEVNPGEPLRDKVLIIAECEHSEPSRPIDKNGDGIFTLLDTIRGR